MWVTPTPVQLTGQFATPAEFTNRPASDVELLPAAVLPGSSSPKPRAGEAGGAGEGDVEYVKFVVRSFITRRVICTTRYAPGWSTVHTALLFVMLKAAQ